MPNEHFCLKWNNFQKNIVAALGNLKLDEDFVDVTLSCEGKTIKAHKVILSACSDYFRDVFRDNPCKHPVVILRDASFIDVEGLVRYVYRGEVDVQPDQLQSFLSTAELLKIKGLADQNLCGGDGGDTSGTLSSSSAAAVAVTGDSRKAVIASSQSPIIKVPVPPKRPAPNNFTSLAKYLSGSLHNEDSAEGNISAESSSSSSTTNNNNNSGQSSSKRRKATPKRYNTNPVNSSEHMVQPNKPLSPPASAANQQVAQKQHYSGSTSSLTASPSSPPLSHSTEGGDLALEICEDSDRESARSSEERSYSTNKRSSPKTTAADEEDQLEDKKYQPMDDSDAPLVIHEEDRSNDSLDLTAAASEKFKSTPAAAGRPARSMDQEQHIPTSNNSPVNQQHISSGNGMLEVSKAITTQTAMASAVLTTVAATQRGLQEYITARTNQPVAMAAPPPMALVRPNEELISIKEQPLNNMQQVESKAAASAGEDVNEGSLKKVKSGKKHKKAKKEKDGGHVQACPPPQEAGLDGEGGDGPKDDSHPRNRWRCMQPRVCNYCWKTFSNSFNLKQHIVNVHVQSQGVACTLCDKIVKNKWYLRKHLVTAHGAPLKRVKTADGGIAVPPTDKDPEPQAVVQQQQPQPAAAAHITVPQPLILNQNPGQQIAAALTNTIGKNFVLPLFSYDPATAALVGVMSGAQAVIPNQPPPAPLTAVAAAPSTTAIPAGVSPEDNETAEDEDEELDVDN